MKKICLGLLVLGSLALPQPAAARNNTAVGVGTGAVAGALVAGPLGAVVGGIVGGVVGAGSESPRPRRARSVRRRLAAPVQVARKPAAIRPAVAPPKAEAAAAPATTWTNPR